MLSKEQIELINNKSSIIEPCVKFARQFLALPSIDVSFDDCPSARFRTMDNAAEGGIDANGRGHIVINGPWFAERIEAHQDDVEFFIFHELRHIHQHTQIRLMVSGQSTRETANLVETWKDGFGNYVRNEGGDTQVINVSQEIEVDANAYGIILEMLYRNGKSPLLSIPAEALNLAEARLQNYIDTLPEFSKFSRKNANRINNSAQEGSIAKPEKID